MTAAERIARDLAGRTRTARPPAGPLLVALVVARGGTCNSGHPWDEANTYVTPAGHRQCRACRAARKAAAS